MTVRSETERPPPFLADGGKLGSAAFWAGVRADWAACRPVFIFAGLYGLAALLLPPILAGEQHLAFTAYTGLWLKAGLGFGFLFLVAKTLPTVLRRRPDRPLFALASEMSRYLTPSAVIGVALLAVQALIMGTFTSVKNMLPDIAEYSWDASWASVDAFLAFGVDPWWHLKPIVSHPAALHAIEVAYLTGWMVMIGLVPAIIAFSPRFAPIRVRFFLTYILCWILIGNLLALAGMSAGPAFFDEVTGDTARFGQLLTYLSANSGSDYSAYDLQNALWQTYKSDMMSLGSGVSAFPSMHVSMATLWVIVGFIAGRIFAVAALMFLIFIEVASVALGWHYAIDGYASIVLTPLIWLAVGKGLTLARRRQPIPPVAAGS